MVVITLPLTNACQGLADLYLSKWNHRTLKKWIETTENCLSINLIFLLSPGLHFFFDRHCKVTKMFRVVGLFMQYFKYEKFILFSQLLNRCVTFRNEKRTVTVPATGSVWPLIKVQLMKDALPDFLIGRECCTPSCPPLLVQFSLYFLQSICHLV